MSLISEMDDGRLCGGRREVVATERPHMASVQPLQPSVCHNLLSITKNKHLHEKILKKIKKILDKIQQHEYNDKCV